MAYHTLLIACIAGALSGYLTAKIATRRIETLMAATKDQLDAEITAVGTAVTQLGTDLTDAITALEAKIVAAGTPVDLTNELNSLTAIATQLQGLDTTAVAAGTYTPPTASS